MNILMTGASGLVGSALVKTLVEEGHTISRLVRSENQPARNMRGVIDIPWDPRTGEISNSANADVSQIYSSTDAVINLAGAPIAGGRWTEKRKALLRSSRIDTTRSLVRAIANMKKRPKVLISASAIGYYGDRGDEVLTENSAPGTDFLGIVAKTWEEEALKAEELGLRVVRARLGVVLARDGGALPQMMRAFKFGLGGKLGSGCQWMSWITLEDVVGIVRMALATDDLRGAINFVSPEPVRNTDFASALGRAMHRPSILAAPAFGLKIVMGEMSDIVLASTRVIPQALQQHGYSFLHTDLDEALRMIVS